MSLMLLLVSSLLVVYINENSQCSSILGHVFLIMEDPIYSALEKLHFKRGASPFFLCSAKCEPPCTNIVFPFGLVAAVCGPFRGSLLRLRIVDGRLSLWLGQRNAGFLVLLLAFLPKVWFCVTQLPYLTLILV